MSGIENVNPSADNPNNISFGTDASFDDSASMFIHNNKGDASGTKRPNNVPNSASSNDAQASKKVKTSVDQSDISSAAANDDGASMILNTGMYMSFTTNSTSEKQVPVQNFTELHEKNRVLQQQVKDMKARVIQYKALISAWMMSPKDTSPVVQSQEHEKNLASLNAMKE